MPPDWLTVLSWTALGVAFACAGWITADVYGRDYRQPMGIMEVVWPVTALYFGPVAVMAYRAWGRPGSAVAGAVTGERRAGDVGHGRLGALRKSWPNGRR